MSPKKSTLRKFILKQDIIISAGTVFEQRFGSSDYSSGAMYQSPVFGLTKDSSGIVTYGIDESDPAITLCFEEVK